MSLNFDLISDLYLESMDDINWENKVTSLFCIVAGNISKNHDVVFDFLEHISEFYEAVFFIDGDLEHDEFEGDFDRSYNSLRQNIEEIPKVIYLHENIVIMHGAALLATNGWTTFNFLNRDLLDSNVDFLSSTGSVPEDTAGQIFRMAITDQHYMCNSIEQAQRMGEIQNLIVITNCVPKSEFVTHDAEYDGTILGETSGNDGLVECLERDTEHKVKTWIFGKYPGDLDYDINGVRYVNNPGKNKDLNIYYPKIIKI